MRNVGTPDRLIRLIVGALLALAPFILPSPLWAEVWATPTAVIVGLVLVATAAVGFCPIYAALRLSTSRKKGGA